METDLFAPENIKIRINPYQYYNTANSKDAFIHVFGNIMEGRTIEQRNHLSKLIVQKLIEMFPEVPVVSMNVQEFEKATYNNRKTV